MNPRFSLLDEALFHVRVGANTRAWTLPDILASLSGHGEALDAFCNLQIHQHQSWFCFLVQLGALALGDDEPIDAYPAFFWRELLLALTQGQHEPWCLVVPDEQKPAFMQPPAPAQHKVISSQEDPYPSLDGMDLLVTSKNFDVKASKIVCAEADHWIYMLVNTQTLQGYSGRGHNGIARMNSGYGSRPLVGMSSSLGWTSRWSRDVGVALEHREKICDSFQYPDAGGHALLWTLPWEGVSTLSPSSLDPFFIEICQRIRLAQRPDGHIEAWFAPSKTERIDVGLQGSDLGDLWTPIKLGKNASERNALTVSEHGFHYGLLRQLLLGDGFQKPKAQEQMDTDRTFWAFALARGGGKTGGLHLRLLDIPPKSRSFLSERPQDLNERAQEQIKAVGTVSKEVLRFALWALYQSGPDKLDFKDDRPQPWLARLDSFVDEVFFEALWEWIEQGQTTDQAQVAWERRLLEHAHALLVEAADSVPLPSVRRYKAQAAGESTFQSRARQHFAQLYANQGADHVEPDLQRA